MIYLKYWKGKTKTKNILLSKALIHIQQKNQKIFRQAKAKSIQRYQTSFTTNAKGTSLDINKKAMTRNENIMSGKAHW